MDITKNCKISSMQSAGIANGIKFLIVEAEGGYGDFIKVNGINGVRLREIIGAYEYPQHRMNAAWDNSDVSVLLGGSKEKSGRTVFVIGK